jgi:4-hydroxy-tetrahydrodipicolinate reductase
MERIKNECLSKGQSLFVASNFSIGMNLFFAINQHFASLMDKFNDYDVSLEEIHHLQKKDKPSGTAITLANQLINSLQRKTNWKLQNSVDHETLLIKSVRENDVPGIHKIIYGSEFDTIELIHSAKNRRGFARGALMAAEWLQGRKGYFGMPDLLNL